MMNHHQAAPRLSGSAEQDSRDWLTSFTWVTLELAQTVAAERWQAIGLSAMLPTLVLTDGTGAAATPGGAGAPSSRDPLEPLVGTEAGHQR